MKKTILLLARTTLVCTRNAASRDRLWAALCLASLLTTATPPARAAVTEAWVHRYNGPSNGSDVAQALAVDSNGNVVVTGSSENSSGSGDYYTAKYAAATGALLWEKRGPSGGAAAVAVDGSGNVVVTGYSSDTNGYVDYYTAKHAAADGALLWEQHYKGTANGYDVAQAVAVDGSGNVVVTGYSNNGAPNYYNDYYTAKYAAADGAMLWEKRYNGPANSDDVSYALAVDGSGNVVVTGYSHGTNFNADYYTAKYAAADGALLWEKRYNGPANGVDFANAVAVDANGNVVVTGNTGGSGNRYDYYTAKYAAADGALLWERNNTNGGYIGFDSAVAVDGCGNVVLGYSYNGANTDYYTAKYAAADGALLWEQRYNGPGNSDDYATAVAVDGSGNVLVTGSSWNGTNSDYYTAKYAAADGALLWEKRYNGPANGDDFVGGNPDSGRVNSHSLALGPNGMVAITGSSFGSGTNYDYATVVYWENLPPVSIDLVPTGIRLRFTGVPGHSYNIERAPAVTGPWSTLATAIAPPGGLIEYVDTKPPVCTAFYRTSAP